MRQRNFKSIHRNRRRPTKKKMSSFCGQMKEYNRIAIDRFDGQNLQCTAFFLSHCHKDHMVGLNSSSFIGSLCKREGVFLYCSEITRLLLLADNEYSELRKYICVLEIAVPQPVRVPSNSVSTSEYFVNVTSISAGHCPGSVMFLFEGHEGTCLYTGDFRWEINHSAGISAFKQDNREKKEIKSLYVDTTFCIPEAYHIPKRSECLDAALILVSDWLQRSSLNVVYVSCPARYGHEHLLMGLSRRLNTKIHVPDWKVQIYEQIPELKNTFTSKADQARIHACSVKAGYTSYLPCNTTSVEGRKLNVLKIRPSTMWFTSDKTQSKPEDLIVAPVSQRGLYRICYSMHSSYRYVTVFHSEIRDLVSYLQPHHVFANVLPMSDTSRQDVQARLASFQKYLNKSRVPTVCVGETHCFQPLGTLRKLVTDSTSKHPLLLQQDSDSSDELVFSSQEKNSKTGLYNSLNKLLCNSSQLLQDQENKLLCNSSQLLQDQENKLLCNSSQLPQENKLLCNSSQLLQDQENKILRNSSQLPLQVVTEELEKSSNSITDKHMSSDDVLNSSELSHSLYKDSRELSHLSYKSSTFSDEELQLFSDYQNDDKTESMKVLQNNEYQGEDKSVCVHFSVGCDVSVITFNTTISHTSGYRLNMADVADNTGSKLQNDDCINNSCPGNETSCPGNETSCQDNEASCQGNEISCPGNETSCQGNENSDDNDDTVFSSQTSPTSQRSFIKTIFPANYSTSDHSSHLWTSDSVPVKVSNTRDVPVSSACDIPIPGTSGIPVPSVSDTPVPSDTLVLGCTHRSSNFFTSDNVSATEKVINSSDSHVPSASDSPVLNSSDSPVPNSSDSSVLNSSDTPVPSSSDSAVLNSSDSPVPNSSDLPVLNSSNAPVPSSNDSPVPNNTYCNSNEIVTVISSSDDSQNTPEQESQTLWSVSYSEDHLMTGRHRSSIDQLMTGRQSCSVDQLMTGRHSCSVDHLMIGRHSCQDKNIHNGTSTDNVNIKTNKDLSFREEGNQHLPNHHLKNCASNVPNIVENDCKNEEGLFLKQLHANISSNFTQEQCSFHLLDDPLFKQNRRTRIQNNTSSLKRIHTTANNILNAGISDVKILKNGRADQEYDCISHKSAVKDKCEMAVKRRADQEYDCISHKSAVKDKCGMEVNRSDCTTICHIKVPSECSADSSHAVPNDSVILLSHCQHDPKLRQHNHEDLRQVSTEIRHASKQEEMIDLTLDDVEDDDVVDLTVNASQ